MKIYYYIGSYIGCLLFSILLIAFGEAVSSVFDFVNKALLISILPMAILLFEAEITPICGGALDKYISLKINRPFRVFFDGACHIFFSCLSAFTVLFICLESGLEFLEEGLFGFASLILTTPAIFMATHIFLLLHGVRLLDRKDRRKGPKRGRGRS